MEVQAQPSLRPTNFKSFLQQELVRRCHANPQYSLRTFARVLEISPSALSAVLNGKRPLTKKMIKRLGLRLELSLHDINKFIAANALTPNREFQQIAIDTFAIISDWYHYAILELIRLKSFRPDKAWVANVLGVTKSEVNIAVERLERAGLLEIGVDGQWIDRTLDGNATNIHEDLTSLASKNLQKQILEMSIKALQEIPIEQRDHTSITMAIDPEDLPIAKEKIKNFRRDLMETLEQTKNPTQVYHLGIALYPVTKIKSGEEL